MINPKGTLTPVNYILNAWGNDGGERVVDEKGDMYIRGKICFFCEVVIYRMVYSHAAAADIEYKLLSKNVCGDCQQKLVDKMYKLR